MFESYEPIENHLDDNASFDCCLFETYGPELAFVEAQPDENVWTLLDCDGYEVIATGRHRVNRIGYLVTKKPWAEFMEFRVSAD